MSSTQICLEVFSSLLFKEIYLYMQIIYTQLHDWWSWSSEHSFVHRVTLVSWGECSVLCHCVWAPAGRNTCVSGAPESLALCLHILHVRWLLWKTAAVDARDGRLWSSVVRLFYAWSLGGAPQLCWPWALAGVERVTRQEGRRRVFVLVVGPWPASDRPLHSWVFLTPKRRQN